MVLDIVYIILGFTILITGADMLVTGSSSLARRYKLPDLIIGLTIIAFGTSAPEFFISLYANVAQKPQIAIGNVLGSSIINMLLILGICALIYPIKVKKSTIYKELPYAFLSLFALVAGIFLIEEDYTLTGISGLIFILFFCVYCIHVYYLSKNHIDIKELARNFKSVYLGDYKSYTYIIVGIVFLFFGSQVVVRRAEIIAEGFHVTRTFIGLVLVSIGTTLPELVTSITAAFKKKPDFSVGNAIGTVIFNIMFILGFNSIITDIKLETQNISDVFVLLSAVIVFAIVLLIGKRYQVSRMEGSIMVLSYFMYFLYLIYRETYLI